MKMNDEQLKAVNAQEGRYLVAAGAGSGKTAVLSQRALKLIKDGKCTIDQLLVLTFTNDAAKEMKGRIYKLLSDAKEESPLCSKAVQNIESSSSMTFDALARALVNEFGVEGDLGYGNATEATSVMELERRKILDSLLNELYEKKDETWLKLVYRYCAKTDDPLVNYILAILSQAEKRPNPEKWLLEACDHFYSDDFIVEKSREYAGRLLPKLRSMMDDLNYIEDESMNQKVGEILEAHYRAANISFDEVLKLGPINLPKYSVKKGVVRSEEDRAMWDSLMSKKKEYNSLVSPYENYGEFVGAIKENEAEVRYLFSLTHELYMRVLQRKREAGLYVFGDIFLEANRLLDNKEILERIRGRYKYVMVDEYQDTSDTQIALLEKIGIENIFMVGDAKQSIYRFRDANPKNFMEEKEKGKSHDGKHNLLVLSKNYRSRESVLSLINSIFENGMTEELGGIAYKEGKENLEFGNLSFSPIEKGSHGYEIHRLDTSSLSGDAVGEWIASDIYKKLTDGYEVKDKSSNMPSLRPCNPGDFAILASSKKHFASYKRILERYGIPCDIGEGDKLTEKDDVMIISSLANFYLYLTSSDQVEEGKRKHAYASIRKSYLYDDDDDAIYHSLENDAYMGESFYLDALANRSKVISSSILEAYDFFLEHYSFLDRVNRKKKVKQSISLLLSLRDQAISMDKLNYSFADFASYFNDLKELGISSSDTGERRSGPAVKLFSIHKSKGLQFPIVYLPSLEGRFNMADAQGNWFVHPSFGAGIPNKGPINPILNLYKSMMKKETIDEEVRKFYVATTRAEELLVFVETSHPDKEGNERDFHEEEYHCYRNILSMAGLDDKVKEEGVIRHEGARYIPQAQEDEKRILLLREINFPSYEAPQASPSKKTLFNDAHEKMKYGLRMHRYMELVDFEKKDVSFIGNPKERERIEKILSLPLIDSKEERRVYKEYSYINEDGSIGIIDLMFVYKGKVVIVDYKSSYIDDEAYISQVSQYCKKAESLFLRPVEGYLLSLHDGRVKKVY